MAKHRKTRKEKLVSEKRRQTPTTQHQSAGQTTSSLFTISTTESRKPDATVSHTIGTHEYGYLSHDLLRTAILTSSIVIAELVLKFIIKI